MKKPPSVIIHNAKKGKCSSNKGSTELRSYMLAFTSPINNFCNTCWNVNFSYFILSHGNHYQGGSFIWGLFESGKDNADRRLFLLLLSLVDSKAISNRDMFVIPTFLEAKMCSSPTKLFHSKQWAQVNFLYLSSTLLQNRHSKNLICSFSL